MPSTYTTSLSLTLPATGELSGTWGTTVNTGVTSLVDDSVAGTTTITMVAADYTLTTTQGATNEARRMFLVLTGTPGAARNVIVPAVSKLYFVFNNTTGGFAQTVKTAAGSGISVPNGARMVLYCNGTDVVQAVTTLLSPTFTSPVLGTPTSGTLSNCTGLPISSGVSGLGTSVATALAVNTGTAGAFVVNGGALGTPSSGTLTNVTGLPLSTGVTGTLGAANGGTGATGFASNRIPYSNGTILTSNANLTYDGTTLNAAGVSIKYPGGGSDNTAIGGQAMSSGAITTAGYDIAIGFASLFNVTSGSYNIALGYQTLGGVTSGNRNTSVGALSSQAIITGSNNTSVGALALQNATGSGNTVIGDISGQAITSGSNNTIIGRYTGYQGGVDIRTANNNIVLSDGGGNPRAYYLSSTNTWTINAQTVLNGGTTFNSSVTPATNMVDSVGYTGTPVNSQSAAYTLVAADAGKSIVHPITDNNARTFTIPDNGTVAFPVGTVLTFINLINTVTIAITTDTMYLAGTGATGSRTLAAYGMASAIKVGTTTWIISGNGLT